MPSKVAQDCYYPIAVYNGVKNPVMGKFPKIKRISVCLTPSLSYRLDLEKMKVDKTSVGDLQIIGYPRNYTLYKDWEIREARLKIVDDKIFLKAF